jgi:uncharacterized protein
MNRQALIQALQQAMPGLSAQFGVLHLDLFGSFAREEAGPDSDVDLLVTFMGEPTFTAFMGLKEHLETQLGRRVDLVTPSGLKPRIRERVMKELHHVA